MDHKELRKGFEACIMTPELAENKRRSIRFQIGEKVQCNTPDGWQTGTVVAHQYHDPEWPPERFAPYQVELDAGELIWAPVDSGECIRAER